MLVTMSFAGSSGGGAGRPAGGRAPAGGAAARRGGRGDRGAGSGGRGAAGSGAGGVVSRAESRHTTARKKRRGSIEIENDPPRPHAKPRAGLAAETLRVTQSSLRVPFYGTENAT